MSAAPVITVVTPTKNRLPLLRETLDSVRRQTLSSWEHIVVDDGSEDGTEAEVLALAAQDGRVRFLRRAGPLTGANPCRNQGAAAARSDLLVFLDSDDLLDPTSLERRVQAMARNQDIDFAVFRTGVFTKAPGDLGRELDPNMHGDDLLRFLFFETPWQTTAPTWRKTAFERLGGFDERLLSWQDVDLHVRALAGGLRYLRFPEVDHHMRWQFEPTKVSVQQRRSAEHLEAAEGVLVKFEEVVRSGPGMTWMRQRALCSLYYFVAEHWVAAGRLRPALRVWTIIRTRRLGSTWLHGPGAALLCLSAMGGPLGRLGRRLIEKWKGLMRLRTEPELVSR